MCRVPRANRAGRQEIGTAIAGGKELAKTPIVGAKSWRTNGFRAWVQAAE
jgi:hypothetical protein